MALPFGLDLNRNFPVDWSPFSMFGMDAGSYPGSEPESRALLDAVSDRDTIVAAVTNHTYTGCILTPPSRKDCPLPASDTALMQRLATDLVEGTGYRVYKVYPEFMYDPDKPIIGTWDDTLSSTFGIVGFTLELWSPYTWAGVEVDDPIRSFRDPDATVLLAMMDQAVKDGDYQPWHPHTHPQLGEVEFGGIDYLRTVRNPPVALLAEELERGFTVADRLRKALPKVEARLEVQGEEVRVVTLHLENLGALSTSSLLQAEKIGTAPAVRAQIELGAGQELVHGPAEQALPHLDGWYRVGFDRSPLYASLPERGHRGMAKWTVRGGGAVKVRYTAGRGGSGVVEG